MLTKKVIKKKIANLDYQSKKSIKHISILGKAHLQVKRSF